MVAGGPSMKAGTTLTISSDRSAQSSHAVGKSGRGGSKQCSFNGESVAAVKKFPFLGVSPGPLNAAEEDVRTNRGLGVCCDGGRGTDKTSLLLYGFGR